MKAKPFLFLLLPLLLSFAPKLSAQANLETLYRSHRFFELRDQVEKIVDDKSPNILFYRGAVANKFNRPQESITLLRKFLSQSRGETDARLIAETYDLLADDYVNLYQYARAVENLKILVNDHKTVLEPDKLREAENDLKAYNAIENTPPQTISFDGDTRLQGTRDRATLPNFPVEINNQKMDFVFDTGANLSVVTVSTAARMKLSIIEADFDTGTSTNERVKSKLAVAPVVKIGNITVRNVLFLVLDDADLAFPQAHYQINGIVGFPVMLAMRQFTITRQNLLIVPAKPAKIEAAQNLFLEGLLPVLEASYNNRRMIFELDTGAVSSTLATPFYESEKKEILKVYKPQKMGIGGAGGVQRVDSYKLKNLVFTVAGKPARFPRIDVVPEEVNDEKKYLYGTFGQDLFRQFDKMTIDFDAMSLVFE